MASRAKLTARAAILKVLGDNGGKMKVPDIIKAAVPLTKLTGKTPGQTIYSTLYSEAKKPHGIFKQTGKGEFQIHRANVTKAEKAATEKAEAKAARASKPAAKRAPRGKNGNGNGEVVETPQVEAVEEVPAA